ncbi:hypothetical protein AVEN_232332-1 [Araneus ventricosus]|uniref:C2H2-type domain-containing protein n=1 Tax=Araneus ventricosus TaxID=182803 RepID=A0A4Y2I8V4_ARAVE|nr:hypothetical protein AVEN_232332-1 [Araneus ventricosus]
MFPCGFCETKFFTEKLLHSHLKDFHKIDCGFFIRGTINGPNTFPNFNALYVHMHRKHNGAHNFFQSSTSDAEICDDRETELLNFPESNNSDYYDSRLGLLILNLRASTKISTKNLNEIIDQMKEIIEGVVQTALNQVNNVLKTEKYQINLPQIVNFDAIIENSVACFKELNSAYL